MFLLCAKQWLNRMNCCSAMSTRPPSNSDMSTSLNTVRVGSTKSGRHSIPCDEKVRLHFSSQRSSNRFITSRLTIHQVSKATGTQGLPTSARKENGLHSHLWTFRHSK